MAVNSKKTTMEINTGLVQPRRPQGGRRGCCSPPARGPMIAARCGVRGPPCRRALSFTYPKRDTAKWRRNIPRSEKVLRQRASHLSTHDDCWCSWGRLRPPHATGHWPPHQGLPPVPRGKRCLPGSERRSTNPCKIQQQKKMIGLECPDSHHMACGFFLNCCSTYPRMP